MTRAKINQLAARLGVDIEEDDGSETLYAYSPVGKVFAGLGVSTINVQYGNCAGGQKWRPRAYKELAEEMAYGVEDAPEGYEGWWSEDED